MNWPYTGEYNINCKVLYYADHICHHYSQYLVTATRWMCPWGTMKEAWSNLMWVMIVSEAAVGPGNGLHYTMQYQPVSIISPCTYSVWTQWLHGTKASILPREQQSTKIRINRRKRCVTCVMRATPAAQTENGNDLITELLLTFQKYISQSDNNHPVWYWNGTETFRRSLCLEAGLTQILS